MSRGPRTRVEPGIFRDAAGLAAVVKVDGRQRERRFPLGTDLRKLRDWRRRTRAALELDLALPDDAPRPTTLADDIATYLALLPAGTYRRDTEDLLAHWRHALGDRPAAQLHHLERALPLPLPLAQMRTIASRNPTAKPTGHAQSDRP